MTVALDASLGVGIDDCSVEIDEALPVQLRNVTIVLHSNKILQERASDMMVLLLQPQFSAEELTNLLHRFKRRAGVVRRDRFARIADGWFTNHQRLDHLSD